MSTIIVRAKVELMDEGELELSQSKDLGSIEYKSKKWVYRRMGIPAEEIIRVIAYTAKKTILVDGYDKMILVDEPFESVYKKWSENYEVDAPEIEADVAEINEEGEKDSEDDDD